MLGGMLIPAPSQDLLAAPGSLGSAKRRSRAVQAVSQGRPAVSSIPAEPRGSAFRGLPQLQVPLLANAPGRSVPNVEPPLGPEPDVGAAQSWLRLGYDLGLLQSRSTMQEFSVALRDTVAKSNHAVTEAPASQERKPSLGRRATKLEQALPGRRASSPGRLTSPPSGSGRPLHPLDAGSHPTTATAEPSSVPASRPDSSNAGVSQAIVASEQPAEEESRPCTASAGSVESALQYEDDSDAVRAEALQQALSFTRVKLRAAATGTAGDARDVSVLEMEAKWLEMQEIQLKTELEKKSLLRRKLLGQLRGEASAALGVLKTAGVDRSTEQKRLEQRVRRLDQLEAAAAARAARLGLISPEEKAKRSRRRQAQQNVGWWNALEARCRAQAKDETTRVAKLRVLLLRAVDALGQDEWERCFSQGNGRLDYVAFGRATRLALAEDVPDDDSIADMFGLVDPNATGVVLAWMFWAYVDAARADPLTQHDQRAAYSQERRSRDTSRRRSPQSDDSGLMDESVSVSDVSSTSARRRELPLVLLHQKQERAEKSSKSVKEAREEEEEEDNEEEQWDLDENAQEHSVDEQEQVIGLDELRQLVDDVNLVVSSSELHKLRKTIESEEEGGRQITLGGFKRWLAREHPGAAEAVLLHKLEIRDGAPATAAFEPGGLGLMDTQQEDSEAYTRWIARKQLSGAAVSGEASSTQSFTNTSLSAQPDGGGKWDDQSVSTTALMYRLARRRLDAQAAEAENKLHCNGNTAEQSQSHVLISTGKRSIFAGAVGVNSLLHFYDTERFGEARPFSPEDGAETSSDTAINPSQMTIDKQTLTAADDSRSRSQRSIRTSLVDSDSLSATHTNSRASSSGRQQDAIDGDVLGRDFSPREDSGGNENDDDVFSTGSKDAIDDSRSTATADRTNVDDPVLMTEHHEARLSTSSTPDQTITLGDDQNEQELMQEESALPELPDAEQVGHTVLVPNGDKRREDFNGAMQPAAGGGGGIARPRGSDFSVVLRRRAD